MSNLRKKDLDHMDYREEKSKVWRFLNEVEKKNLPVGDYLVGGFIVERKTTSDLAGSVMSGRIFSQLSKLKEHKSILLVEGCWRDVYSNINKKALIATVASALIRYGVSVVFCCDPQQTAMFLSSLESEGEKGEPEEFFHVTRARTPKELLMALPLVGPKMADKILEKFSSPLEFFNNSNKWTEIPGFGKKMKEKIERVLGL